jgi:hypothetical protein
MLTVIADNGSRVYGEANPSFAYSASGLKFSDTIDVISAAPTLATTATSATGVGSTPITITGGAANSNYTLAYVNGSLTITQRPVTVTANAQSKTYGDADPALTYSIGATAAGLGLINGDTLAGALTRTAGENVAGGPYAISLGSLAANSNYTLAYTGNALTINPYVVSLTGNRTYNGTASIAAGAVTIGALVGGETLTLSGAGDLADKNVGNNRAMTLGTLALGDGTGLASNYTFTGGTQTATITKANLTLSANSASKTYDGTLTATDTATVSDGTLFSGDTFSGGSFQFTDKNAGSGNKTVTVTGVSISDGNSGGNYQVSYADNNTSTITPKALTAIVAAPNKVYDGTTTAAPTLTITAGLVGSETVSATGSATFNSKDVATANLVTVNGVSLFDGANGGLAGNYSLASGQSAAAGISTKALTASVSAPNKVYDGTTAAAATLTITSGLVGAETVSATGVASFNSKDVLTANLVTVNSSALADGTNGGLAGNYSLAAGQTAAAAITKAPLTVTAIGQNKVYDGTDAATVTLADNRIAGDALTISNSGASFQDKNAANGKTVKVDGIKVTGADAGNYSFNSTAATSADIGKASLTVTATGQNKVYDGTDAATVTFADNRIAGDVLTLSGNASFQDKNAASGKTVNVAGIGVTGADAGNYTFNSTGTTTSADITKASLTVSAIGQNKVYDGTVVATVFLADNRITGDALTLSNSGASFQDKNAASGKTVKVDGISVSGADAGNYSFNTAAATTADISKAPLTVSAIGQNKVYDGTVAATVSLADNRIAGDALTISNSGASFLDKNAASGKTVKVDGIKVTGADAGNYNFNSTAATSADISKASLTVTATGQNKVYDGTVAATVTFADNRIAGDTLTLSGNASFLDKDVANGKTVNVAGINVTGADAGNYAFNGTAATTSADITVRPLSTWTAGNSGLWSNPANWDAIPDGHNVLAVSIPSGGSYQVTYDGGTTTLQNLNSSQTLVLANGNLAIGAALNTTGFQQTGGSLSGDGSLKVSNSFNQTGGSINLKGSATLNQSSGDLTIAGLTASTVGLTAQAGRISQTGPIVASTLTTQSSNGTVLNGDNQVASFSAVNSSSGDIILNNTAAPLNIGAITQSSTGDVVINNTGATITGSEQIASGGSVSISAHSPLTIGSGGVKAVGDVLLEAAASGGGDNLTINGGVASATGSITLKAGDLVIIGTNGSTTAPSGSVTTTDKSGTTKVSAVPAPKLQELVTPIIVTTTTQTSTAQPVVVAFIPPTDQPTTKANTDKANTDKGNTDKGNTDKGNTDKGNTDKANTEQKADTDKANTEQKADTDKANTEQKADTDKTAKEPASTEAASDQSGQQPKKEEKKDDAADKKGKDNNKKSIAEKRDEIKKNKQFCN